MTPKRTEWKSGLNSFAWPTDAVLVPLGVDLGNLGALAELDEGTQTSARLAPVSLGTTPVPATPEFYVLRFSAKYDLKFCDIAVNRRGAQRPVSRDRLEDLVGGEPAALVIRPEKGVSGEYSVFLDCFYKGRKGGPQFEIVFFHAV